jgi:Helix-turn-helix domain
MVRRGLGEGLMLLGRRYRLELDPEQLAYVERAGGICRAVWNAALDQRRAAARLNRGRTEDRRVWPSFDYGDQRR